MLGVAGLNSDASAMKKLIATLTLAAGLLFVFSALAAANPTPARAKVTTHQRHDGHSRRVHARRRSCKAVSRKRRRARVSCPVATPLAPATPLAQAATLPSGRRHRRPPVAPSQGRRPTSTPPATPVSAPMPGLNPSLAVSCTLYASPAGSDTTGDGSIGAPFDSVGKLDAALAPGQTGCLRAGTYGGLTTWQQIETDGTATAPITITSYPGETATVAGWVEIDASYTVLENVHIDGSNTLYPTHPAGVNCTDNVSQPLTIVGHDDVLQYIDYFQSVPALRGNAIGIGFWGDADNTIVRYDTIHDVGGCDFYDHLIYLAHSNNVQVYDNWMWNDAHGWGVKLDPGPQNARIWGNVIDSAGSGFNFGNSSGTTPTTGNQVFDNVVVNSVGVDNPDINWSHQGVLVTTPGLLAGSVGNVVENNDYYNSPGGESELAGVTSSQLSLSGNVTTAPQFADAADHNYTLVNDSLPQMTGFPRQ
jgi:hypothetical protein